MDFEEFKVLYQKVPVDIFPSQTLEISPLVSVCVQTYQHVAYIKQCLDGILTQQTNFSFEILLGDDNSKDGTKEICISYAKKYPEKIRLFLHHRENNIHISGRPTGRFNFLYNIYNARGKYIALCEGDDYWIDPLKLKKQVEFMELNPDYNFSMGKAKILVQSRNEIIIPKYFHVKPNKKEAYILEDYLFKNFSQTSTFLFRNNMEVFDLPSWFITSPAADQTLVAIITSNAKIKFHNEYFSVYRIHSDSITHNVNYKHHYKNVIENLRNINKHFEFKYNKILMMRIISAKIKCFAFSTKNKFAIKALPWFYDKLTLLFYNRFIKNKTQNNQ